VPTVSLRPMRDDEFARWLPTVLDGYAASIAEHAGMDPDLARRKAEADTEALFPGGRPSPDQWVYVVEADGEWVGGLWIAERDLEDGRVLWIYDVDIDEPHRGNGYGKAAMQFAEEEARRRSLTAVTLNVFGGNDVARNLYRSLGYSEIAVLMKKPL
jgi:GNAT superfamily N-acetyltransferase